jgi:peroxiredoxin
MKKLAFLLLIFSACFLQMQATERIRLVLSDVNNDVTAEERAAQLIEQLLGQLLLLNVNDTAKDFTVQMITGETITLSDLRGRVVLLNFGATWCAPCMRKLRAFPALIEPFENSAFVLLPILMNEMDCLKEQMEQFKKDGIDFNIGSDPERLIFSLYTRGFATFLIDKNGIIRHTAIGYSEEGMNELATMIQKLLELPNIP